MTHPPKKAAEGPPMHVISLGAGVQSSAMALMAARGEITPMPEAAIFADTKSEPREVYRWLAWLKNNLPFPVFTVSRGNLGKDACVVKKSKKGNNYTGHAVPAFIKDPQGRVGLAMRQCTTDHKINVIYQKLNILRNKRDVVQWVGISFDEREKEERRRGFEAAKKRAAEAVKRFLPTEIRRFAEATLLKEIESLTDDGKE